MKKILLVEDDSIVSTTLKRRLENAGFEVFQAFNGAIAMRKILSIAPDCILLDIGLPEKSGYDVCKEIRTFYEGGIIFLTAHDDTKVEWICFELGADDFVSKKAPFEILLQRIKRLNRVFEKPLVEQVLNANGMVFSAGCLECRYKGTTIQLTQEEFELFYYLALNEGKPLSRQNLLHVLKGLKYNGIDRSIDIKIARIRKKIKKAGLSSNIIKSVRTKGYQYNCPSTID